MEAVYFMVEIFKTNVESREESEKLARTLKKKFPLLKINFDLDDCDKILRVEGQHILVEAIIREMKLKKYSCELLG
jgi:hypothetical protein